MSHKCSLLKGCQSLKWLFLCRDHYTGPAYPIPNATLVRLSSNDGSLVASGALDRFYMPHMVTVDSQGNVWVTDVGLHQVEKKALVVIHVERDFSQGVSL